MEIYFKSIFAHNTVIMDNCSPLKLVSRFIYSPLPKAEVKKFQTEGSQIYFEGINLAYNQTPRNTKHIRKILADDRKWQIIDEISSDNSHTAQLRWHLHPKAELVYQDDNSAMINLPGNWTLEIADTDNIDFQILTGRQNGGWNSQRLYRQSASTGSRRYPERKAKAGTGTARMPIEPGTSAQSL